MDRSKQVPTKLKHFARYVTRFKQTGQNYDMRQGGRRCWKYNLPCFQYKWRIIFTKTLPLIIFKMTQDKSWHDEGPLLLVGFVDQSSRMVNSNGALEISTNNSTRRRLSSSTNSSLKFLSTTQNCSLWLLCCSIAKFDVKIIFLLSSTDTKKVVAWVTNKKVSS